MLHGIALHPGGNHVPRRASPSLSGGFSGTRRQGPGRYARAHDPLYLEFLRNLRHARTTAAITQVELAAALDRPQSFVAKIEAGVRRVDVAEAMRIAAILGSSLPELLPASDRLNLSRLPRRSGTRPPKRGIS